MPNRSATGSLRTRHLRESRFGAPARLVAILAATASSGCANIAVKPASAAPPIHPPGYPARLTSLVESFQPADPDLPDRWSQVVRTAFLYSGALRMFAVNSEPVQQYLTADPDRRRPEDFMLVALAEPSTSDPSLAAEARRFLDVLEAQGLLVHLHQIAEPCRLTAPPPNPRMPLTMQESYEQAAIRNLSLACCLRMRIAAGAIVAPRENTPQAGEFLRSFASGMHLGRALCGRPTLLSLMNAQALQNGVMLTAIACIRGGRLDADTMRELCHYASDLTRLPHPATFLEVERVIGLDALDRYFRQRAREQAAATEGTISTAQLSADEARAAFEHAIDRAVAILRQEIGESDLEAQSRATSGITLSTLELPEGRTDPDGILASLMPPLSSFITAELEYRCIRAALDTAILLELHRLEHGGYPRSIAELAPPPASDPLGPGHPLGYIPPTDFAGYALYSVGSDRVDNGGTLPPSSRPRRDALFVPARWTGSDFVIGDPRSP